MTTLREIVNRFICCADDDVEEDRYMEDIALRERLAAGLPGGCWVMNEHGQFELLHVDPPQFNFNFSHLSTTVNYVKRNLTIKKDGTVIIPKDSVPGFDVD